MPVPTSIAMPKLGMTMREGAVIEWRAAVGDRVEKGSIVLVIESEKSEVEIAAPASGVLRHIYVEAGTTVPCGTLLAAITESADEAFDAEAFRASLAPVAPIPAPAAASRGATAAAGGHVTAVSAGADVAPPEAPATPAARRLATRARRRSYARRGQRPRRTHHARRRSGARNALGGTCRGRAGRVARCSHGWLGPRRCLAARIWHRHFRIRRCRSRACPVMPAARDQSARASASPTHRRPTSMMLRRRRATLHA